MASVELRGLTKKYGSNAVVDNISMTIDHGTLVCLLGPSFAMEIFYTARQFTAAEALAMGLVNRVVADGELESFVKSYADMIAGNAPLTIKAVKAVVSEMMKDEKTRDLKRAQAAVDACFKSRDYEEGRKAFMEKRKPVFTGR